MTNTEILVQVGKQAGAENINITDCAKYVVAESWRTGISYEESARLTEQVFKAFTAGDNATDEVLRNRFAFMVRKISTYNSEVMEQVMENGVDIEKIISYLQER